MKTFTIVIIIATVGVNANTSAICGTVRDQTSNLPLKGAFMVLAGGKLDIMYRDSTYTDADGAYCFNSLADRADYSLSVSKYGYLSQGRYPVIAHEDSIVENHFSLSVAKSISGTVVDGRTGAPLAGAVVCTGQLLDTTNGSGEFLLSGLSDVKYMQVKKPEYLTTGFELQENGGELRLELPPVPPGISDLSHMEILVSDFAQSNPIQGAAVDVKLVKSRDRAPLDTLMTTKADGLVRLTGLNYVQEAGEYRCIRSVGIGYLIRVSREGYGDESIGPVQIFENEIYRVNVPLKKKTLLHTRVLDIEGRPVQDAVLSRFDATSARYSITDENGWSTWDGFLSGEYDITVAADGMETRVVKTSLSGEGFSDTQTVTLQPFEQGKTLSGYLRSDDNRPLEPSMLRYIDSVVTFIADFHQSRLTLVAFRDSTSFHFNGIPSEVDSGFLCPAEADYQKVILKETNTSTELRISLPSIGTEMSRVSFQGRRKPFANGAVIRFGGSSNLQHTVRLFDMRGRLVYLRKVADNTDVLDLSKEVPNLKGFFACFVIDENYTSQSFPLLLKN